MQYITKDFSEISGKEVREEFISLLSDNDIQSPEILYDWLYTAIYPSSNLKTRTIFFNDELIGFGSILFFNLDLLKIGSLVNLYIDKKHRTLGPALILQKSLLDSVVGKNCDVLIGKPNKKAEVVFCRLGYEKIGIMKRYILLINPSYYLTGNQWILRVTDFFIRPFVAFYFSIMNWSNGLKFPGCVSLELEFIDDPESYLGIHSKFHYWRYLESNDTDFKVCRVKFKNKEDSFIVYHLQDDVLTIDDIRNITNDCREKAISYFIYHVVKKYKLKSILIAIVSNAEFLNLLKGMGFIERTDGSEQSIYFMDCHQPSSVGKEEVLRHFLFPTNLDF